MMPLSMVSEGEPQVIKKVGGKEETRKFLENLGFVQGATVTVLVPLPSEGDIESYLSSFADKDEVPFHNP